MKKFTLFLLLALLSFGMVACAEQVTTYEYTVNGETYAIDVAKQTLTHKDAVYTYENLRKQSEGVFQGGTIRLTYPDGTWYQSDIDSDWRFVLGTEKTSSNYDENTYPRGGDMFHALEKALLQAAEANDSTAGDETGMKIVFVVLFGVPGVVCLIFPEAACHLGHSMWIKNAEPSEFALGYTRGVGVFLIVISLGVLILM